MNVEWSKTHAVLIGDRWIAVRDGAECNGDLSFELGGGVTMIASKSAVQAVKIAKQTIETTFERYTPWGTK